MFDIAVVGAGPAGAYAAYLLAGHGFNVLVIEKEAVPRDKVCGGAISKKTTELLDFDISSVVQRPISGAYLTYRNRDTVVKDFPSPVGWTTRRRDFDHLILEHATARGAHFKTRTAFVGATRRGQAIEVATTSGTFRARYLLGADGVFSRVRAHCFPRGLVTYTPSVVALVRVPSHRLETLCGRVLFDFGGMSRGYGWIFPKRDHLNVGVFSVFPSPDVKNQLWKFMSRYGLLRDYDDVKVRGSCVPVKNTRGQFQDRNIWLLGDAAGLAESFYGEGIFFALKSATLAAATLAKSFDDVGSRHYSERVRRELHPDLFYSHVTARLFFSFPAFGFRHLVSSGRVAGDFSDLIAGRIGHRACFYKTLVTAPQWAFSTEPAPVPPVEL